MLLEEDESRKLSVERRQNLEIRRCRGKVQEIQKYLAHINRVGFPLGQFVFVDERG